MQAYGLYTYKALTAGRHFNLLALACLAATVVSMYMKHIARRTLAR
jgi:hypothetical protein